MFNQVAFNDKFIRDVRRMFQCQLNFWTSIIHRTNAFLNWLWHCTVPCIDDTQSDDPIVAIIIGIVPSRYLPLNFCAQLIGITTSAGAKWFFLHFANEIYRSPLSCHTWPNKFSLFWQSRAQLCKYSHCVINSMMQRWLHTSPCHGLLCSLLVFVVMHAYTCSIPSFSLADSISQIEVVYLISFFFLNLFVRFQILFRMYGKANFYLFAQK